MIDYDSPEPVKVTIAHDPTCCRCDVDGTAIIVKPPCFVLGSRLTKSRMAQLLFNMSRKK